MTQQIKADDRIVRYMKNRNAQAETTACAVAVQLFALAVYFSLYALVFSGLFFSLSADKGKVIMIVVSVLIAVILCVINVFTVMRAQKVYITKPDAIAIRDSEEIVRVAYKTARPLLIYRITLSLVIMAASVMVYIIIRIPMTDHALAGLYGRIVICLAGAAAIYIAYPCIDRIACYRALLKETSELYFDTVFESFLAYIAAFVFPASICVWYILKYYGNMPKTAWIVFPVAALFSLAAVFLKKWAKMR